MERKPLVYIEETGETRVLPDGDKLVSTSVNVVIEPTFSFKRIVQGRTLLIRANQQMLVKGDITIIGNLRVEAEGEVWLV